MELGTQIRKYRNERTLSQEALAEKVYVSRQTVSNWENDKSYPDVNSLVAAGIVSIYRWEKQETEPKGRNLLQHMCESEQSAEKQRIRRKTV